MNDLVERLPKEAAMLREIAQSYSRGVEWQANLSASAAVIDQAAARITTLEASLAEAEGRVIAARRQALEEAAMVADARWDHWRNEHEMTNEDAALFIAETCESIGIAIRALLARQE